MQTVKEFQQIVEGKAFMQDYHTMVIPLRPSEMPTDEQLARLATDVWYDIPSLSARLLEAQAQIDEIDGQRVLIIWFKRWPSDPTGEDYDA